MSIACLAIEFGERMFLRLEPNNALRSVRRSLKPVI